MLLMAPLTAISDDESALESKSQALILEYATELRGALTRAMSDGAPATAISVCKVEAPRIAARLSRESGATVRRTSLNYRNPNNAPDAWEASVLDKFTAGGQEHAELTESGEYRFMQAIPVQSLCLACHGKTLAPDVVEQLDAAYPDDLARGYQIDDVRGAFSVAWPAAVENESK